MPRRAFLPKTSVGLPNFTDTALTGVSRMFCLLAGLVLYFGYSMWHSAKEKKQRQKELEEQKEKDMADQMGEQTVLERPKTGHRKQRWRHRTRDSNWQRKNATWWSTSKTCASSSWQYNWQKSFQWCCYYRKVLWKCHYWVREDEWRRWSVGSIFKVTTPGCRIKGAIRWEANKPTAAEVTRACISSGLYCKWKSNAFGLLKLAGTCHRASRRGRGKIKQAYGREQPLLSPTTTSTGTAPSRSWKSQ